MVERKHRHLLKTARALSFQSNLPSIFWGDVVQCATYLINRMPLTSLGNISPYEKLFGHSPNNEHLRAFGCLCFPLRSNKVALSSTLELLNASLLGIPMAKKGTKFITLKLNKFLYPEMFIFLKNTSPTTTHKLLTLLFFNSIFQLPPHLPQFFDPY